MFSCILKILFASYSLNVLVINSTPEGGIKESYFAISESNVRPIEDVNGIERVSGRFDVTICAPNVSLELVKKFMTVSHVLFIPYPCCTRDVFEESIKDRDLLGGFSVYASTETGGNAQVIDLGNDSFNHVLFACYPQLGKDNKAVTRLKKIIISSLAEQTGTDGQGEQRCFPFFVLTPE